MAFHLLFYILLYIYTLTSHKNENNSYVKSMRTPYFDEVSFFLKFVCIFETLRKVFHFISASDSIYCIPSMSFSILTISLMTYNLFLSLHTAQFCPDSGTVVHGDNPFEILFLVFLRKPEFPGSSSLAGPFEDSGPRPTILITVTFKASHFVLPVNRNQIFLFQSSLLF